MPTRKLNKKSTNQQLKTKRKTKTKKIPPPPPLNTLLNINNPKRQTESDIQEAFFTWVSFQPDTRLQTMFSIPNGAYVHPFTAKKLKKTGLKPGVADAFLPIPSKLHHGMFLEFKTKTGYQSLAQKQFQRSCQLNGYNYEIAKSVEEAIAVVNSYLHC